MPRPNALAGTMLGKYKVLRKIGRGGMAHVYLAEDTTLKRKVALKVLDATRSADEHFVKRFQREARTAAALKHPNIVTIYEVGEIDGVYFIAMEYLTGRPLKDILVAAQEKGQLLNLDYAFNVIAQVADALTYAYETAKIVHRDVKPSNIMVDDEGHVTLTDFGIARALEEESDLTSDSGFIGTPMYMSPEHIEGGTIDHRSDVYSLGVVVYQILVGGGPFGQTTTSGQIMYKHVHAQPISPRKLNKRVNSRVEQVVLKALAKKPGKRYQTAREFSNALQKAYASRLPVIPKWVVVAITIIMLGLITVGVAYTLGFTPSVLQSYITNILQNSIQQTGMAQTNIPKKTIPVITGGQFVLRTGPGDAYDELGLLEANTQLVIRARNEDGSWAKIETQDGTVGWMNATNFGELNLSSLPLAVIPPSPTPTAAVTPSPTPSPIPSPTAVVIIVTSTPSPTPTRTPTRTPTQTSTPRPTRPPTATPTQTPTPTPVPISGKIVFSMDDGFGHYDVWVKYLPDGVPARVVQGARQPNISKNTGRMLVNGADNPAGTNNILVTNSSLSGITMVSDAPDDAYPFWDPDGVRYVFSNDNLLQGQGGRQFIFVPCSLKRPQQESDEKCRDINHYGFLYPGVDNTAGDILGEAPVWTADGRHSIVFRGDGGRSPNGGIYSVPSWATKRDGGGQLNPTLLIRTSDGRPSDVFGNYVFFFANDIDGNWEVYRMNVDGSNLVNLSNSPGSSDGLPTVSPDGYWVAFASDRDGYWAIYVVSINGGTAQKLFNFPKANPWGVGNRDWTTERISWGP